MVSWKERMLLNSWIVMLVDVMYYFIDGGFVII